MTEECDRPTIDKLDILLLGITGNGYYWECLDRNDGWGGGAGEWGDSR